jgi:UDP-N-acetylmuramyl pentapeptide phosphotransferase/UDP-N-acetylglucosamine-1-phosphate transferase
MTAARWVGLILIVLGTLGLVFGGITYTRNRQALDIGPLEVNVEEKESIPVPPLLGGLAIVAGIAMLTLGGRRRSA